MSGSISGIYGNIGTFSAYGGAGEAKSIIEGTLAESEKWQARAQAPLKVPDARILFAIGRNVDYTV